MISRTRAAAPSVLLAALAACGGEGDEAAGTLRDAAAGTRR